MELRETVDGMLSDDYRERFVAEYQQLDIRQEKLTDLLSKMDAGELEFEPDCPRRLLQEQASLQSKLKLVMMERAACEGIKLP